MNIVLAYHPTFVSAKDRQLSSQIFNFDHTTLKTCQRGAIYQEYGTWITTTADSRPGVTFRLREVSYLTGPRYCFLLILFTFTPKRAQQKLTMFFFFILICFFIFILYFFFIYTTNYYLVFFFLICLFVL